jgi:lipopolysaccharide export system protein LptA
VIRYARSTVAVGVALGLWLGLLAGSPAVGQTAAPQPTCPASPAPQPKPAAQQQEYPLHITAAQMEADQDKRVIVFSGQVKADYADYTLYADKLLIYYRPVGKGPSAGAEKKQAASPASPVEGLSGDKIDRIEAWGHVRCVQGDRVASGEKAIFYKDKEQIILLGNPQLWRGEDHLKGSKIIMYLATKKVEVEGSPGQRVEAHLYQTAGKGQSPADFFSPGSRRVPPTGRRR